MTQDDAAAAHLDARRTMVDTQVRPSDVTDAALIDAMLWAPRERFFPAAKAALAYVGEDVEIATGRYELDPRVAAKLLDAAQLQSGDLVLVVGGGSGYVPALCARLAQAVVALEPDETLSADGAASIADLGVDTVVSVVGPLAAGCPAHAPFDAIVVNGAVEAGPSDDLLGQLAEGGRMAVLRRDGPVGRCEVITRSGESFGRRWAFDATAPVLPGFEAGDAFTF